MTLADMGAEVVRIDRPGGLGVFPGDPTQDLLNRGKRSVCHLAPSRLTRAGKSDSRSNGSRRAIGATRAHHRPMMANYVIA